MIKSIIEKMLLRMLYRFKITGPKQTGFNGAQILAYHEIGRSNFEEHIRYLKSLDYHIISIDELTRCLYSAASMPHNSIVITFDDGWKSNYTEVFPVVCKYEIPMMIYIVSQVYVTDYKPWFFLLAELKSSGIQNIPSEAKLSGYNDDMRNHIVQELTVQYADQLIRSHTLSGSEIIDMANSGFVSVGSHTVSHPNLNHIGMEQVEIELFKSKRDIELLLNHSIDHFAYPEGYFSVKHFDIVRNAGYKTAVTTIPGWNNPKMGTNPFELRRIFISGKDDVSMLSAKLSGLWHKIHRKKLISW